MKLTILGLAILLTLTVTSSTERISGWGPMVMMWLLTTVGTSWVLAGEPEDRRSGTSASKKAA
jgi:hypothetical protein